MITINRTGLDLNNKMSPSGSATNILLRQHGSLSNSPDKVPRNAVNKTYLNNLASSAHMNSGKLILQGVSNSPTS